LREKEAANQNLLAGRLDLVAEVDRRFVRLLGAQSRLRIAAESRAAAEMTTAAVTALVQAGEAAPIEELRARSEEALARVDFEAVRRERFIARRALSQLWGLEEPDFDSAEGALAEEVPIPDEESALARLKILPDLARRRAETRRLEARNRLARLFRWPDLTLSIGQRRFTETGERAYLAGVSIPLPLFNRNRGAVIEASARLDQGRLEERAEETTLRADVHSAYETLTGSASEVRILGEEIVPKAKLVHDAIQEGYRRGKYGLLDLLQTQKTLLEANLRHLDALVRLNLAKADLERLIGVPLETIEGAPRDSE
jgi:cobalt-zinc-cadmium efflux system outer membrane protein